MKKHFDVFGLGQCSLDYLGQIEAYPPADVKCEFNNLTMQGGGPVATALVALSRWGLSCVFAGVVGDDSFAQSIIESLQKEGIDTRGLLVRKKSTSQFAFIVAERKTGRRTIFWTRPTGAPLQSTELDAKLIRQSRIFHTDGLFTDAAIAAAEIAKNSSIPVVVDAGSLRDGMLELAKFSDFYIASEVFAQALINDDDPLEACRQLAGLGPRLACVTLGKKGYVARYRGTTIHGRAYSVDASDTTGCGDVFHAGFIYGLRFGWNHLRSLDFAAWAAAMVSRKLGGRAGIPSVQDYPMGEHGPPLTPTPL